MSSVVLLSDRPQDNQPFSRIGKGNAYYQWTQEHHGDFLDWWSTTPWILDQEIDHTPTIKWDISSRKSVVWGSYFQAAHRITGCPMVICQACDASLSHPHIKNTGTSALAGHLKSRACIRITTRSTQPQIHEALQKTTVLFIPLYS